jgi:LCP family protein required for cell wall assembly
MLRSSKKRPQCCGCGLGCSLTLLFLILITLYVYTATPERTNILLLGIDSRDNTKLGRSDTLILFTTNPSQPYVGILSIPRDLWVEIPGYGDERINTANFFAEAHNPGTGPSLAMETIIHNFGINVAYYIRINMVGFLDIIDALGGIDVQLPISSAGYAKGHHHLNSEQVLAFVRDREITDDFYRMKRGQIILKALISRMLNPTSWLKLPETIRLLVNNVETNLPVWCWPKLASTILRVGPKNIDSRTIERDMVDPYITEEGAHVLIPRWDEINPILSEMFGQ